MITGKQWRDAVISGANSIIKVKKSVDELNIFPVPDGDTGTNMSMTIGAASAALAELEDTATAAEVAKCTASAMLVLLTPGWADSGKTGIALIQQTLSGQLGEWTNVFMSVTVLFFAFSSIIGNYFYGEINMDFISRHSAALWIYRAFVVMMVYLGSVASLGLD